MANINKIQLPNGTQYDIEDAVARANIVNTLSALSDTTITNPADGQVLTYDSTTGKWVNAAADASFDVQIVQTLPTTNIDTHTIYFVPVPAAVVGTAQVGSSTVGSENDVYDEYMYVNNQWEKIGDTRIDLSDYAKKSEIVAQVQSDWIEEDTTSLAHVLNRPAIRAGEGENSIIEGRLEQDDDAAIYTLTINGDAGATIYTYTTQDTLPTITSFTAFGVAKYGTTYSSINAITSTNITLDKTLSSSDAIVNGVLTVYIKYKMANGYGSISSGGLTCATGEYSHAEGSRTKAISQWSHAEGVGNKAVATGSHAEGYQTKTFGNYSHAEGTGSQTTASWSHAEGRYTIAGSQCQHTEGKFNIEDSNDVYAHIVGNGSSQIARSNAYTLDWNGNGWYAGKVSAGTVASPATVTNANDLTTKAYVDTLVSGSSDVMIITVTSEEDQQTGEMVYSADKTFAEISAHITSGGMAIVKYTKTIYNPEDQEDITEATTYLPLYQYADLEGEEILVFACINEDAFNVDDGHYIRDVVTIFTDGEDDQVGVSSDECLFGSLLVNFWFENASYHADKTYNDITIALQHGISVFGYYHSSNVDKIYQLTYGRSLSGTYVFVYNYPHRSADLGYPVLTCETLTINVDNSVTYDTICSNWLIPQSPINEESLPLPDGTASIGSSIAYALFDHVHPTDTSRAPVNSPALTGTPTAPTAAAGTNTTQIATTQFVNSAVSSALTSVMTYKGTKATVAALPSSGNAVGDVWHVTANGSEYAWDGSTWQELGTADKEVMVVNVTGEEDQQTGDMVYSADKTFAEISAHLSGGGSAICIVDDWLILYPVNITQFAITFEFASVGYQEIGDYATIAGGGVEINSSDEVLYWTSNNSRLNIPLLENILTKTNTTAFTPTADYQPATKKYVDDNTGVTYQLSMTNNVITLTGSDSSTSSVTLPVYNGSVSVVTGGGS